MPPRSSQGVYGSALTRFVDRIQALAPSQVPVSRGDEKGRTGSGAVRNPAWDREVDIGFRGRCYSLSRDGVRVLHDVTAFRVVEKEDLLKFACDGDRKRLDRALGHLESSGLIQSRRVYCHETNTHIELLSARAHGAKLISSAKEFGDKQAFFHGFVKPRESLHDSAIYRMFQIEAQRIASSGGSVSRIVLDFELKRELFTRISARKDGLKETDSEARKVVAENLKLAIVKNRIQLPDLRLEYEDASGTRAHVDLELATHHYKQSQLAAKAQAGFRIYTTGSGSVPYDERILRLFEI